MSMILGLTALGDATIVRLLADPPLVWRVIAPDDPERYDDAVANAPPSLWSRLTGKTKPEGGDTFTVPAGEGLAMDIDKAWHGLHYLFTGTADGGKPSLNFLLGGGRTIGTVDVGYGPARALSARETRAVHDALAAATEDQLRARFDPAAMTRLEIYPDIWTDSDEEDDPLAYLIEHARALKDFVGHAASRNQGLLIHLS
jgi:hypothetical protein